jgi:hypothetical protein
VSSVIMSLAVTATFTEMFWCTTTFQKNVISCVWQLIQQQKSTHSDSESELHWCMTVNEFSSDSMWYIAVQTEHSHWAAWEWPLSERSEHTSKLLLINKENRIDISICKSENDNISVVQNKSLQVVSSETHTCTTLTWWLLLLLLLLLSLLYESQCWHIQSRKISHTKGVDEEVEEKRKRSCMRWGVYNSLHWQISKWIVEENHASNEKFSSANLTHTKRKNMSTDIDNCTTTFSEA